MSSAASWLVILVWHEMVLAFTAWLAAFRGLCMNSSCFRHLDVARGVRAPRLCNCVKCSSSQICIMMRFSGKWCVGMC